MKELITNIVRKLTSWAWRKEEILAKSTALLKELNMTPGAMEMHIEQSPEQAKYVALCFASMIANSPNYTEMKFDLVAEKRDDKYEWITVLIKKDKGMTPHELRMQAEKERDEAKKKLEDYIKDSIPMESFKAFQQGYDEILSDRNALRLGCKSALAYLTDPPSEFKSNRNEAERIIRDALKQSE